jgi:hypothetical protein
MVHSFHFAVDLMMTYLVLKQFTGFLLWAK